jgi:hypothetical protein
MYDRGEQVKGVPAGKSQQGFKDEPLMDELIKRTLQRLFVISR